MKGDLQTHMKHINLEKLKIRMSGSESLAQTFLTRLGNGAIDSIRKDAQGFITASDDEKTIRAFVHTLKGAARTACFDELERRALMLEMMTPWDRARAAEILGSIVEECGEIERELSQLVSG
jgi:HPt (histidine-containing phosphotransfer) domain-containing protein